MKYISLGLLIGMWTSLCAAQDKPYDSGVKWIEPTVVKPAKMVGAPPSDAIVLFDGSDLSQWNGGKDWVLREGYMQVGKTWLSTKRQFGDFQMHIEWATPNPPKESGQRRGNSGIYIMGKYELQVLDSYDNPTYFDGQAASVYKQTPPAVNAMRPPGEWNSYDIFWTAPKFSSKGKLESPAFITVLHNGVLVLNHFQLKGRTHHKKPPSYEPHPAKAPIGLQNKHQPVRYRNIWIREFQPAQIKQATSANSK